MELGKKLALVRQGEGEKYVVLKRRSQEAAPGPPAGMALWEGPRAGPEEEAALPHILVTDFSASSTAAWGSLEGVPATAPNPQPESEPPRAAEEDAESISKPESEQDASEDGGSSLGSSSVALDPVEKEWLQGAASGHLLTLSHLLKQEPSLATRKDFTSGFTALHWAAKHGKEDLVSLLVAAGADVNTRSHGYTPLHIAALHGHRQVMDLLVRSYGAKQNVRDHSGHLARHYLGAEKPLDRAATLPRDGCLQPPAPAPARPRAVCPLLRPGPARGAVPSQGGHLPGEHQRPEGLAGPALEEPLPQQGREGHAGHHQQDEPPPGLHVVRQRPPAPQEGEASALGPPQQVGQRCQRGRGGVRATAGRGAGWQPQGGQPWPLSGVRAPAAKPQAQRCWADTGDAAPAAQALVSG